ncbi:MAG: AraC family transcriptional regulator [Clostridia bacterium]|nr:AraC family transcriptional regulator [Clostridia bacterium]
MSLLPASLYDPALRRGCFLPLAMGYYDRPDMLSTTDAHAPPHHHNLIEIMYVIFGRAVIRLKGCEAKLGQGEMILIDKDVPHALELFDGEKCSMINIEFGFKQFDNDGLSIRNLAIRHAPFGEMLENPREYLTIRDEDGMILRLLKQTVAISDSVHAQSPRLSSMLAGMILICVASRWKNRMAGRFAPVNKYVEIAMDTIDSGDLSENISVSSLAARAGISPSYLIRLFKAECGITPNQYILKARLERAKRLIEQTDHSIIHITTSVGLTSERYFSRVFRREYGQSPSACRRNRLIAGADGAAKADLGI